MLRGRPHQVRTVESVRARWRLGPCRICCVAPTGAGKTVIGILLMTEGNWLWIAHTRDLVFQSAARIEEEYPGEVGIIMAGCPRKQARIQVCSIETLLSRDLLPEGSVILDEVHHYASKEWSAYATRLFGRNILGLTATPARADGVGLRGLFDDLTVSAHYSELIRDGHIVAPRVLRPAKRLRGIAADPVTAYLEHGEGRLGFTFCRTVKIARDTAEKYTAFGVPAACVDFESEGRQETIAALGPKLKMLTSVYALTEGVDVPAASCCVLARGCGHPSLLLQMAGRVLRSCKGKTDALLLDLPGVTWELGLPHEDREYSLDGVARKDKALTLSVCQQCGFTQESGGLRCERCGFKLPPKDLAPKIHNAELGEHEQLEATLKLSLLLKEAERKGYHDDWVSQRFKSEYGYIPKLESTVERKIAMYQRFKMQAQQMGYSFAYAAARYKSVYGVYPSRSW